MNPQTRFAGRIFAGSVRVAFSTCPVCEREEEDFFHVLCARDNAQRIWKAMSKIWELPELTSIKHHDDWFIQLMRDVDVHARVRVLMLL